MADQPAADEASAPVAAPEATPAAPADGEAAADDANKEVKEKRPPLTPEEAAKRKAERDARRKEQRKAARDAAKEARARGEPPKPKAPKAEKAAKAGEGGAPEGAAPKITVMNLPVDITTAEFKALFEPHGTVLRAEVSKRKERPTIGTVYYNTHAEVRRAVAALSGKHKCDGQEEPISIQYGRDAVAWGTTVKKTTDDVANCLGQHGYKQTFLKSNGAKDFLNRMIFSRKKIPETSLLTAGLLVQQGLAKTEELVDSKMINSTGPLNQLLQDEKVKPFSGASAKEPARATVRGKKEDTKAGLKLEKTFDAVVPHLDKLEKDRWNRMAKANLRLNERHRFRFVDILATPSLELWRWMVEDCEITPAEAGTCFAILQNYYGFTK